MDMPSHSNGHQFFSSSKRFSPPTQHIIYISIYMTPKYRHQQNQISIQNNNIQHFHMSKPTIPLSKPRSKQFVFSFMEEDQVEEAAHMATIGFLKFNTMWINLKASYDEAFNFNRFRILQSVKKNWAFAFRESQTNQLVAISTGFDLYTYFHKNQAFPNKYNWLLYLKSWGGTLEKEVLDEFFSETKQGEYIYGDFGTVNTKFERTGIAYKFYALGMIYMMECGYKGYMTRATHMATVKMIQKMGGRVLKSKQIEDPNRPELGKEFNAIVFLEFKDLTIKSLDQIYGIKGEKDEIW